MMSILVALILSTLCSKGASQKPFDLQAVTLSFLERPTEPVSIPKGSNGIILSVPEYYLTEKYKDEHLASITQAAPGPSFGGAGFADDACAPSSGQKTTTIVINEIGYKKDLSYLPPYPATEGYFPSQPATSRPSTTSAPAPKIPDISSLLVLRRRDSFSSFNPLHRKLAARLVEILVGMENVNDFVSAAAYIRDRVNPNLFVNAFSTAILHRPDAAQVKLPRLSETFPDKFVDGSIFVQAREEAHHRGFARTPLEIPVDYTATNLELEHRVAYFREDLGVNTHHWHWHLTYPGMGLRKVVEKDRRGELFYYMHQQIIARYDYERMCNKLPRVKRLQNFNEPIEEAYFSKLNSQVASKNWAGRPSGTTLRDVNREFISEQLKFDIAELQRWRGRIFDAIHRGKFEFSNGTTAPLTERDGIDVLGNMIEPSDLSPNMQLYGSMHTLLHVAASVVHDPDNRHLESFSVLGDLATAMRDPVFYRIHAMVNDMFATYKKTLTSYSVDQLDFSGVNITSVELNTPGSPHSNVLETFWQKGIIDINRGMDFNPRGSGNEVYAKYTHLNHEDFQYKITVDNSGQPRQALVRLFLAPKLDEKGQPWLFEDQRHLFIELDKFFVNLTSGENVITRDSRLSSVTIPFERSFKDLEKGTDIDNSTEEVKEESFFCGCGWPHHLLIPKGIPEGFPSVLFAMVSNYETDWNPLAANRGKSRCSDAASYCGIRDQAYPDRRAMGYPFDRTPRDKVKSTDEFLTANMALGDVYIRFTNRVVDPHKNPYQDEQIENSGLTPNFVN